MRRPPPSVMPLSLPQGRRMSSGAYVPSLPVAFLVVGTALTSLLAQTPIDGASSAKVQLLGERKQWHKLTLRIDGPFASEQDRAPNPFTDYRLEAHFQHDAEDGTWVVPGYFAADGNAALTEFSLQTNHPRFIHAHRRTLEWIKKTERAGRPWVVACDEPGDASHALVPDADDPTHNDARRNALWGHLLAGGAGNEWHFGYRHAHSDLTCQD